MEGSRVANKMDWGTGLFWAVVVVGAGGAFGAGYWYTYGATVSVSTKTPGEAVVTPRPLATAAPTEAPAAASPEAPVAEATPAPGVVPYETTEPATPVATATPRSYEEAFSTPVPATPTPVPVEPKPRSDVYRVQVGPFEDEASATKQVADLQSAGINAVVVYDAGRYHAQIGAFRDKSRAISVADEVNVRGFSVTIRH